MYIYMYTYMQTYTRIHARTHARAHTHSQRNQHFLDLSPLYYRTDAHPGSQYYEGYTQERTDSHPMQPTSTNPPEAAVYVAGRVAANGCGQDARIDTERECRAAALALGRPFVTSGAWGNAPRGCLFDVRGAFYNTHATGGCSGNCWSNRMTPICVRRSASGVAGDGGERGPEGQDVGGGGEYPKEYSERRDCLHHCVPGPIGLLPRMLLHMFVVDDI